MKYLYCLVKGERGSSFSADLSSRMIYQIRFKTISALVSDITLKEISREVEHVFRHHEVVNQAGISFSSVIPCRFGTVVRNEEEVLWLLKEQYASLKEYLRDSRAKLRWESKQSLKRRVTMTKAV